MINNVYLIKNYQRQAISNSFPDMLKDRVVCAHCPSSMFKLNYLGDLHCAACKKKHSMRAEML